MGRTRPLVLSALSALVLVAVMCPMTEAQSGRGRGRSAPPAGETGTPLDQGQQGLEVRQVLQAVVRGEGRQVLAHYEAVAAQAEREGDRTRAARASVAVGAAAFRLGRYQKAIQVCRHALEMFKTLDVPSNLLIVTAGYTHLASAYQQVGDLAQARAVLEEGLALVEASGRGRAAGMAAGRLSAYLSHVAYATGDYPTALTRAELALRHADEELARMPLHAPDQARYGLRHHAAQALRAAARAHQALGHLDEADAAFERGLKIARSGGFREVEISILMNQGYLVASRGQWPKAVAIYEQGLALAKPTGQPYPLMRMNDGLAHALDGLGRTADALAAAREAVRHVEAVRGELGEAGLRSGFVEDKQQIYQRAVHLAVKAGRHDEGFAFAEQSRARAFLDLLGNQTTLSKGKTRALVDEEVRLRARLAEARAAIVDAGGEGPDSPEVGRGQVEAAEREYRVFLDRVRQENIEQASLMTVEPVTLGEIQGLLPDGTTLLEYVTGREDTLLWVVDRERATVMRLPVDYTTLVSQVRRFRGEIAAQANIAAVQRDAEALYQRLIEPARREIRGDRLLIVPHGVLHYLPFGALRSAEGRWLAEDFGLAALPSASVLRYLGDKAGALGRVLAVGNPDAGAGATLRWAEREARVAGQIAPDATVLVGAGATEYQVKRLIEGAAFVHFATHGELSQSDPLSSALLLTPGDGEDGRLEVRELFGLDLHARLVVLSACETGLGKLSRGDELVGLLRAFLYAGTPAVVATLWKVDDRASYELMRAFYAHLERDGPVEALRAAQRETMRAFPHPFGWAGFGLTGAPR